MPSSFQLYYHPLVVKNDLPSLSPTDKARIKKAIETKLSVAPHHFGEPLKRTLKGYWKLRAGPWRIIFKIDGQSVLILKIGHRRDIYRTLPRIKLR